MTQEEKLAILADAEVRAYETVKAMDGPGMASEHFLHLLHAVDQLRWMQDIISHPDRFPDPEADFTPPPPPIPGVVTAPKSDPKPDSETDPDALTLAEVKKKMIQYQTAHNLDIAALMRSMGYQKLSEIPAEKYDELLSRAEAAVKEKD